METKMNAQRHLVT